ncbi:hypothetical protein KEM56_000422 [Ascosphaera pollenicola]|nr:hypothetical protein KEM56_000422 [Ascosphaera pollenicola]
MPKIAPSRACSARVAPPLQISNGRILPPSFYLESFQGQVSHESLDGLFYDSWSLKTCLSANRNAKPAWKSKPQRSQSLNLRTADAQGVWRKTRMKFAEGDEDPDSSNERIVQLGKTLRTLSAHLPSIFVHALPQEITSPNMTLQLFPSTHPRIPVIKGRMSCTAALWTAPVAWGSVPIVGNVRIIITSKRMVKESSSSSESASINPAGHNKLIVRWRTEGIHDVTSSSRRTEGDAMKDRNRGSDGDSALSHSSAGTNRGLSALLGGDAPIFQLRNEEQFTGLFVFSFDENGRISNLTIEHAEDSNYREQPARMVSLTDWLLGKPDIGVNNAPSPAMSVAPCRKG